jgi:hypothetical protein
VTVIAATAAVGSGFPETRRETALRATELRPTGRRFTERLFMEHYYISFNPHMAQKI